MKKLIVAIIVIVCLFIGFNYYNQKKPVEPTLGVALPQVTALFEDSLATSISSTATSMTLVRGTDKQGNSLSGYYGFILAEGAADEEFITANCTGTTCTGLSRGISVTTATSSVATLKYSHRRATSVKATDYPILGVLRNVINGNEKFPNQIGLAQDFVSGSASTTDFATKKYVDTVGAGGFTAANIAANKGLYALGTAPETVGVSLSATASGLVFGGTGAQLLVNSGYGLIIGADNQLKVATSTPWVFGSSLTVTGTLSITGLATSTRMVVGNQRVTSNAASSTAGLVVTSGIFNQGNSTTTGSAHLGEYCINNICTTQPMFIIATSTVATTSFTGSLTETSVKTVTIPANSLGTAGFARITFSGVYDYGSGNNSTMPFKFGSEYICSPNAGGIGLPDSDVNFGGVITIINDNATNIQRVITTVTFDDYNGYGLGSVTGCQKRIYQDTTANQDLDFRVDLNTQTDGILYINSILVETKKYNK